MKEFVERFEILYKKVDTLKRKKIIKIYMLVFCCVVDLLFHLFVKLMTKQFTSQRRYIYLFY